jgi:hypothetical protein
MGKPDANRMKIGLVVFEIRAFSLWPGTGRAGRLGLGPGWDPGQSRVFPLVQDMMKKSSPLSEADKLIL